MFRIRAGAAVALAFALTTFGVADDPPKKEGAPASPADKVKALQKGAKDDWNNFLRAYNKLGKSEEDQKKGEELYKAYGKGQEERFVAATAIAEADPKSDAGFAAVEWLLTETRSLYVPDGDPAGMRAVKLATEHHAANPKIGKAVSTLGYYMPHPSSKQYEPVLALIKAVLEKNPDKTARAQAALALAIQTKGKANEAEYKARFMKGVDAEKLAAAAEAEYEKVIKEYGDCPWLTREKGGTVGEYAKVELFELRNLRVGKTAPDVEGEDLDGTRFKLSDYRGKVVVLDFWGDW